jgi:hypothetical protein
MKNHLHSLYYAIVEPNGVNNSLAILKCCLPKGMPTIVQHKIIPIVISIIANGKPVIQIQNRFNKKFPVPPTGLKTYFPNGDRQSVPILKHCFPSGIPIIVIVQNIPAKYQNNPMTPPPERNHIMLLIKHMDTHIPSISY